MADKITLIPPHDSNQSAGSQYPPGAPTYPPASAYGQPPPSGYGQPPPSGYGQPPPSGYGQPPSSSYRQPMAPGYGQPGPQGQQNTVIIQPRTADVIQRFGSTPMTVRCPICHADIITAVEYKGGCGPGLWLGCCVIRSKDVIHYCPYCLQVIGKYDHFS